VSPALPTEIKLGIHKARMKIIKANVFPNFPSFSFPLPSAIIIDISTLLKLLELSSITRQRKFF